MPSLSCLRQKASALCLIAVVVALLFAAPTLLRPAPASAQVTCGGIFYPSGSVCGNTGNPAGTGGVLCNGVFYPSGTTCGTVGPSGLGGAFCGGIFYPSGTLCGNTGPAVLIAVIPNQGPPGGGNTVTLTGSGLSGATKVNFGATPTASFTILSDSQIIAVVPPGSGTVGVTVTTFGAASNSVPYTYVLAATLTSVTPPSGPPAGGTTVVLTGSGFTGSSAVFFGATPAAFTVNSNTQITAVAPPGTGTVSVTVVTGGSVSNALPYSYIVAPVLTSVVPPSGPAVGGTSVTLTGTGFTGATAVGFGATAATFVVNSDTQITATAPAGSGTVNVTVTTPGGTSNSLPYTYISVTLTSVSPGGLCGLPLLVILTGSGFTGATSVTFGGIPGSGLVVVSDTTIDVLPPLATPNGAPVVVTAPGGTSNSLPYSCI